ncbi:MAG TPA: hypothetical protein VJ063_12050, partial [Verrucomicrobiae bacterium]|nr:hypothetical protein [Verrucomicrobiae bacterium]
MKTTHLIPRSIRSAFERFEFGIGSSIHPFIHSSTHPGAAPSSVPRSRGSSSDSFKVESSMLNVQRSSLHRHQRGGILVTTIIFCALVGLVLVAYLSMLKSQHKFTYRSQVWNDCVPLCEAGIEEALAHMNYSGTSTNFGINGWVLSANAYRKEIKLNDGTVR